VTSVRLNAVATDKEVSGCGVAIFENGRYCPRLPIQLDPKYIAGIPYVQSPMPLDRPRGPCYDLAKLNSQRLGIGIVAFKAGLRELAPWLKGQCQRRR
jgi:hypothetical protein